jgi:hypothetical protein
VVTATTVIPRGGERALVLMQVQAPLLGQAVYARTPIVRTSLAEPPLLNDRYGSAAPLLCQSDHKTGGTHRTR